MLPDYRIRLERDNPQICEIASTIGTIVTFFTSTLPAAAAAAGAAVAGTAGSDVALGILGGAEGAALGATEGALTGSGAGKGALFGGITGGAIGGLSGPLEAATGLSPTVAEGLVGAGAGAVGGLATGQNPLVSGLEGGAAGLVSGAVSGGTSTTPSAGGAGGGTGSAAAVAAPPGVLGASPDVGSGITVQGPSDITPPGVTVSGGGLAGMTQGELGSAAAGGTIGGLAGAGALTPPTTVGPTPNASGLPGDVGAGASGSSIPTSGLPTGAGSDVALTSNLPSSAGATSGNGFSESVATPGQLSDALGSSYRAGPTTTGAPASGSGGSFMDTLGKNPLLVGALGLDLLNANKQPKYAGNLSGEAGLLARQGSELTNYELSGTLPPGIQANLTAAGDAAAASIRSQYASRGMSGSSAEAADLQSLGIRIQGQGQQFAQQLWQQGIQETQMSNQLYSELMQQAIQQDNALGQSIGNLAGAMAMMSRPIQPTSSFEPTSPVGLQ